MVLSYEQIQKALQEKPNSRSLTVAKLHQQRIKFHTEKRVSSFYSTQLCAQATQFLNWVENLLPHDKFVFFKSNFRYPVKTNEVTGVCFDKLSRIFEGRNPVSQFRFVNNEYANDWEDYRLNVLKEPRIWQTKGWEYFKTEINSVLVVDMAMEQTTSFPEPYFYWLTIDRVITYVAREDGQLEFLIFRDNGRIIVIDDISYRVWSNPKGTDTIQGEPIVENVHGLGYCPARFFWQEAIDLHLPDVKVSPLTTQLESLDWYLFFHLSKRNLDCHAAYPIFSGYEQSCDYSNAENGDFCDGGFLKDKEGHYKIDQAGVLMRCPKCGNKRIVGPGTFVEIPIPNADEHQPDLKNPVQMLKVDRGGLDYNVEECERLRKEIITNVVGQEEIVTAQEALNERQVSASFEEQTTILNRIKKGFEAAQLWVDETICRLRYGDYFISGYVDYGNEFFLTSVEKLREQYKIAKEGGANESELDALQRRIIQTEYRNDPIAQQRMMILSELEPYSHLSRTELMEMQAKGLINDQDLRIKLNFSNFVRRFERENIDIVEFGSELPLERKIEIIRAEFAKYAGE